MKNFKPYIQFAKNNRAFKVPIDGSRVGRYNSSMRSNPVGWHDFTIEEIEDIIRSGDLDTLRQLSRYYYRTNSEYRENIDYLATLPFYDTIVTPIFEEGKGSKAQITKAFYSACDFVDKLDPKNTFTRITKSWLINGMYNGILRQVGDKVSIQDLPLEYCRTRFKDFNNLNILEFNVTYFERLFHDDKERAQVIASFPEPIQKHWRLWKEKKTADPWVMLSSADGGINFCFSDDQTPLLIAAIPRLRNLKDAVGREEKRDENELHKLLIQRMPIDNQGELVFELPEVEDIHQGVAAMLQDLDTVDVLTTFGETSLENLQDSSAASQSADRIEKYSKNAWNALGRGSILFNAENSSTLAYSIKKDESLMKSYLNMYSTWIKYEINSRFSRTGLSFDFEILPTTMFNIKDYQSMYFQGAQFGYSKMRAGVASGIKQLAQLSLMNFENDFLKMSEKMIPLMSSYTTSANGDSKSGSSSGGSKTTSVTVGNQGGRPELPDEEKSEKTQANIAAMG